MKTFYILVLSVFVFMNSYSQNAEYETKSDSASDMHSDPLILNKINIKPAPEKVHLSLQTGVSFFSDGKESAFSKWIAPAATYNFTPQFHFTVGTVAMFNNGGYLNYSLNNEGVKTVSQNSNKGQYFLFAQGEYLLNSNITVRGTLMREVPVNQINQNASSLSSIGVDFKITDNFTISADCRISKGYNASSMHNINDYNFPSFPMSGGFYNRTR